MSVIESKKNDKDKLFKVKKDGKQLTSYVVQKKKIWKSLKQIIVQEKSLHWDDNSVHYSQIDSPPSFKPAKKYSDISGLIAPYTDPLTKLQYANGEEYQTIQNFPSDIVSGYLTLRRALNPI